MWVFVMLFVIHILLIEKPTIKEFIDRTCCFFFWMLSLFTHCHTHHQ